MTADIEAVTEAIVTTFVEHTIKVGVMASPNHWAHRSHHGNGIEAIWFTHCGTGYEDERGCGWDSEPEVYPNREEARAAGAAHLADEVRKTLEGMD